MHAPTRALGLALLVTACVCATVAVASSRSFPPPGRIVYSSPTGPPGSNSYSLFTAATDGRGARQTTSNPSGEDWAPRWSPDGRQVAFTRGALNPMHSSVWVVNADGTNAHRVSGKLTYAGYPKWSPDGRWIAFQHQTSYDDLGSPENTSYELWRVRPSGSDLRWLDAGSSFTSDVRFIMWGNGWAWSPDSKQIVFGGANESSDPDHPTINVLELASGRKRRLTTGSYPVWSPDGTRIAFVENCRISLVSAKGGKRTAITPRPQHGACLADLGWSPDGRWIAAIDTEGIEFLRFVARPDGKQPIRAPRIWPTAVHWPDDCKRLFFYQTPDPSTPGLAGWIVPGPRGLPRFAGVPPRTKTSSQIDWRC